MGAGYPWGVCQCPRVSVGNASALFQGVIRRGICRAGAAETVVVLRRAERGDRIRWVLVRVKMGHVVPETENQTASVSSWRTYWYLGTGLTFVCYSARLHRF